MCNVRKISGVSDSLLLQYEDELVEMSNSLLLKFV
jgi:hypothetical protein